MFIDVILLCQAVKRRSWLAHFTLVVFSVRQRSPVLKALIHANTTHWI